MIKTRHYLISTIIFLLLTSCGYSVLNLEGNYNISEIRSIGDSKINYTIKRKILNFSKKDSSNLVKIVLNTKIHKIVKDRSMSNKITKYELKIDSSVEYEVINKNIKNQFNINKIGDYKVQSKHSDTVNNEKNLIKRLSNELSEEIIDKIIIELNDI